MTEASLAQSISGLLADRKAADIVILDVSGLSSVTDTFIIATGRSGVHVKSVCRHLEESLRARGVRAISSEGVDHGQWALLDYGEVVVHVFQESARNLYDLERLWSKAPRTTPEDRTAAAGTRS